MSKSTIVNGVNVDDLFSTIEAIKDQPAIAEFKFKAANTWQDGGLNRTKIQDFFGAGQVQSRENSFVLDADEPPVLLSKDAGPNPVEYALTALAACVTTSIVYHAAARGITIKSLESRLEGDIDLHGFLGLDDKVRNGYEGVQMVFKIEADAPREQLEEILKLGPTYSPVFDIFTNSVPVTTRLEQDAVEAQ